MAANEWKNAQNLALGIDDDPILIPEEAYAEALALNRMSLLGRVLNPRRQNIHALITKLPRCFGLGDSDAVHGRDLGDGNFQFLFKEEYDMRFVMERGPWRFNDWLVVLRRWEDERGPDFLNSVPIWVQIHGIPIEYRSEVVVRAVGSSIGQVLKIELDDWSDTQVRFVRVRVNLSTDTRLRFRRVLSFASGEFVTVKMRYEKLRSFCHNCGALTHETKVCTVVRIEEPDRRSGSSSLQSGGFSDDDFSQQGGEEGIVQGPLQQLEPGAVADDPDGEGEQQQLDGIGTDADPAPAQRRFEQGDSSAEGSKRKFEAVEEDDDDAMRVYRRWRCFED